MEASYCLDTNILIDYFRGQQESVELVRSLLKQGKVYTTEITRFELCSGESYPKAKPIITLFFNYITILPFEKNSAEKAGEIYRKFKKVGNLPNISDILIAAIAISHNLTVVTKNRKDFERIDGVKLY